MYGHPDAVWTSVRTPYISLLILKLAWLTPNLGILWISVCSFWPCGSIVANSINYRLVPSPSRFEKRQWLNRHGTVAPRYNEVSRYLKNVRYSGVFVIITNYLVNNKNIRYSGVTKLNQAEPSWTIGYSTRKTVYRLAREQLLLN